MTKSQKRKSNRVGGQIDNCESPPYALDPIINAIRRFTNEFKSLYRRRPIIWEPCAGSGYLAAALDHLLGSNAVVIASTHDPQNPDKPLDQSVFPVSDHDFLTWQPLNGFDLIVTNPPYSIKPKIVARCYELKKPFALLMPGEFYATSNAVDLFQEDSKYGICVPNGRINFKMPNFGWSGTENARTEKNKWVSARTKNWLKHPVKKHWVDDPQHGKKLAAPPVSHFPAVWYCHDLGFSGIAFGPVFRRHHTEIDPPPGSACGPVSGSGSFNPIHFKYYDPIHD